MRFVTFIWQFVKPLPPLVFTLVIGAASIAPEDAVSNLSKWAHAIGFDRLPAWLIERSADKHVIIISSIAGAVYFAWLFYSLLQRESPFWKWALWGGIAVFGVYSIMVFSEQLPT